MMRKFFLLGCILLTCALAAEERFVIAIHGITVDSKSMFAISRTLKCAGDDVYLLDYPSTEGTICSHAQDLCCILHDVAAKQPGRPIDFVTHSIGAIILRQTLNIEGCPREAKIGRTVMFAPPNRGSELARKWKGFPPVSFCLGTKIGCELMTYDAETIKSIGPFPSSMDILVIAGCKGSNMLFSEGTPNDGFITVEEAKLDTPYHFKTFRVNHGRILTYPPALNLMREFIDHGNSESEGGMTASEPTK